MALDTISREAGDSGKGFRLQLIRAIKLMLSTISEDSNAVFFTAVENLEDVSHQTIADGKVTNYFEEDKNYDLKGNFTIFSPPVINTLVSFFDIYINQFRSSDNVYLGFYTTRNLGKERKSTRCDGESISLPSKPILELVSSQEEIPDHVVDLVKVILTEEYTSQYKGRTKKGNLDTLAAMTTSSFRNFLTTISWSFGQEDETDLKTTVLKDIERSPLHNNSHVGKEKLIFALMMEKLSERQNCNDLVAKMVHSSDVKLIFKEAESQALDENIDPTWRYITELEKGISDKRNLKEKILAVIADFPDNRIRSLARKASSSKFEEMETDKTFLSLKYRVLDACEEYFGNEDYTPPSTSSELDQILKNLVEKAASDIKELGKDYRYTVSNNRTIEGIVCDLFDCCFLAFDEHINE